MNNNEINMNEINADHSVTLTTLEAGKSRQLNLIVLNKHESGAISRHILFNTYLHAPHSTRRQNSCIFAMFNANSRKMNPEEPKSASNPCRNSNLGMFNIARTSNSFNAWTIDGTISESFVPASFHDNVRECVLELIAIAKSGPIDEALYTKWYDAYTSAISAGLLVRSNIIYVRPNGLVPCTIIHQQFNVDGHSTLSNDAIFGASSLVSFAPTLNNFVGHINVKNSAGIDSTHSAFPLGRISTRSGNSAFRAESTVSSGQNIANIRCIVVDYQQNQDVTYRLDALEKVLGSTKELIITKGSLSVGAYSDTPASELVGGVSLASKFTVTVDSYLAHSSLSVNTPVVQGVDSSLLSLDGGEVSDEVVSVLDEEVLEGNSVLVGEDDPF